ncbi:hypothetical protein EVAR_49987_1 [Eumeta japonica]|uniref:Uncharacterized protein n=1 Tax=Eumeta variegata TaxID=151549 RepID=A0A4C1XMZ2_EUMVA|nr:hypothetical protein EVAR_49987_1 [Eumeta japonica]
MNVKNIVRIGVDDRRLRNVVLLRYRRVVRSMTRHFLIRLRINTGSMQTSSFVIDTHNTGSETRDTTEPRQARALGPRAPPSSAPRAVQQRKGIVMQ